MELLDFNFFFKKKNCINFFLYFLILLIFNLFFFFKKKNGDKFLVYVLIPIIVNLCLISILIYFLSKKVSHGYVTIRNFYFFLVRKRIRHIHLFLFQYKATPPF